MTLFRNLRIWRLDDPINSLGVDLDGDGVLRGNVFASCAPGQSESMGWEEIGGEGLCRWVSGAVILRCRFQERVLPAAAIEEEVAERAADLEEQEGAPIRGARRRELSDQVRAELLPRAPLKSVRHWMVIDPEHGRILVDSATASVGESMLSLLRSSVGNLGVRPLAFTRPIDGSLTTWLISGDLPERFEIGQWADLEHPQDTANKVRFRCQRLDEDEVTATLDRGLRVTALELLHHDGAEEPLKLTLSEDGSMRRIRIPEGEPGGGSEESEIARLDADMALTILSLRRTFAALFPALGGVAAE